MNLLVQLGNLLSNFMALAEHDAFVDSTAYHSPAIESELRFSPRNALRRHY
jgi:hypothetical protein